MTVIERMARAMQYSHDPDYSPDYIGMAREALEVLRDSFADPVVRAAIQAALDEKEG